MTLKNHSKVLHTIKIKEHDIHALIKYEGNKHKILRLCKKKKRKKR